MERRYTIDIAKAICICLVVIGHFNPDVSPQWWVDADRFIYTFHMPVFMFLSGLLFSYTKKSIAYPAFVYSKFKRLMIPYFFTSVVIISLKLITQNIFPVKNTVSPFAYIEMFFRPAAASHLWFIWNLMTLFMLVPIIRSRFYRYSLFALALTLWSTSVPLPDLFSLTFLPYFAVFFIAGMIVQEVESVTSLFKGTGRVLSLICITLFIVLEVVLIIEPATESYLRCILPFLGIVTVLTISRQIDLHCSGYARKIILCISESSFFIYLFHDIFIEFIKIVISRFGITTTSRFTVALILCSLTGIIIPAVIYKLFVVKSPLLRFLTGSK